MGGGGDFKGCDLWRGLPVISDEEDRGILALQPLLPLSPQLTNSFAPLLALSHRSKANGSVSPWIQTLTIISQKKFFLFLFFSKLNYLWYFLQLSQLTQYKITFFFPIGIAKFRGGESGQWCVDRYLMIVSQGNSSIYIYIYLPM